MKEDSQQQSATNSQITVNHKSVTVHVPDIFGAMKVFEPDKFYRDKPIKK